MSKSLLPGGPIVADRTAARDVIRRLDNGTRMLVLIRNRETPWRVTLMAVIEDAMVVTREYSTNPCLISFHAIDAIELEQEDAA